MSWFNQPGFEQPLAQQLVLGHGETMPFGQGQHEEIGVEDFHCQRVGDNYVWTSLPAFPVNDLIESSPSTCTGRAGQELLVERVAEGDSDTQV